MEDSDKICLCFGVTQRQIEKFIRLEKPVRHSQLSECYGAGTGCGWCRPFLEKIFDAKTEVDLTSSGSSSPSVIEMDREQYARARSQYRKEKRDSI